MAKKKRAQLKEEVTPAPQDPGIQSPGPLSRAWLFLENLSASPRFFWLCAVLAPLAVLAYYPGSQSLQGDYDIWFHLAYGKHYVENLTWHIDHSMFSWTPADPEWMYVTWLGSSVLYLVHKTLGVPGLFVLHYAMLFASAAVVFRLARSANIRAGSSLLIGLLLVAVVMRIEATLIRPAMFSIFLTTLTAALYLRFRMEPRTWIIAAFPALFWFWINTHGFWIFGLAFMGLVFAVEWIRYIVRRDKAMSLAAMIHLSCAAGLTLIALCINPHGIYYPLQTAYGIIAPFFSSFGAPAPGAADLGLLGDIIAYESMWEHLLLKESLFRSVSALGMAAMFIVFLAAWAVSWKRSGHADPPVATANIVFFFMGMSMARLVLVYALIWIPSMVFFAWRAGPGTLFPRGRVLLPAVFLVLIGHIAHTTICIYEDRSWFGAGYQDFIPDKEARFIMDNNLPGPMFNDYLSGGYLMWAMHPDYKVFLDPRHGPYLKQVFPDFMSIGSRFPLDENGLQAFTARYPARIALIHHREPNLIIWFHRSPDWTMVYFDTAAVVMARKDVMPTLGPEAENAFHDPSEYKHVGNPDVLKYLFTAYSLRGTDEAFQIRDFYAQNVSNFYWRKKTVLAVMDQILARRKAQKARQ
jgi:hypothetical protein